MIFIVRKRILSIWASKFGNVAASKSQKIIKIKNYNFYITR